MHVPIIDENDKIIKKLLAKKMLLWMAKNLHAQSKDNRLSGSIVRC